MKQLPKQQIFYLAAGVLIFILFFWIFIYAPANRKLSRIKQKLAYTENQIADIAGIAQGRDLSEAMAKLNKDLIRSASRLPLRRETVTNYLSDNAARFNIDVKNMVLAQNRAITGKIPGLEIDETPITMTLTADYRSLGDFLNSLTNDESMLIILKKLEIQGAGEGRTKLDITLKVNAYLAKEAAGK